jgi:hypothetical protein
MMRQRPSGERGNVCTSLEPVGVPPSVVLGRLMAGGGRTGAVVCDTPSCTERSLSLSLLSAGISKYPVGSPEAHDDAHGYATSWAQGDTRWRGYAPPGFALHGLSLHDQEADGHEREGTAGLEKTAMPDFHDAIGQARLEEPPDTLQRVEVEEAWAGTAHLAGGESDGAVREADETLVGDSDSEDIGGEVGEGGVTVVIGLTMDIPRDSPDLGIDVLQPSGVAHLFFAARTGDGREGFDGDKEVGAGGAPGHAVLGEAAARDGGVDVGVVLELPAPGRQDAGATRMVCPDEPLVVGQPFEGERRGGDHGVGRAARRRAEAGSERLRHGAGAEAVRPGPRCGPVVLEPVRGLRRRTLGPGAVATGMLDAVVPPTAGALREARAVRAARALLDGAEALSV